MLWFLLAGALVGAFWGVVTSVAWKAAQKLPKFPIWPVLVATALGAAFGAAKYFSI